MFEKVLQLALEYAKLKLPEDKIEKKEEVRRIVRSTNLPLFFLNQRHEAIKSGSFIGFT